jgi:hypothetical protein
VSCGEPSRICRRNTLRGSVQTVLAVIEDQAFDWRYSVDTSGSVALHELTIDSRHVAHGVDYTPTRTRYFREILPALRVPQGSVLVDMGSGKGRILMLAARSGCSGRSWASNCRPICATLRSETSAVFSAITLAT